jgi:hypothetical protein
MITKFENVFDATTYAKAGICYSVNIAPDFTSISSGGHK